MPRVYGENGLIQNDAATDGINSVDTDENWTKPNAADDDYDARFKNTSVMKRRVR
jgi:hypothetical protein